jgi:hypothetical protein
MDNGEEAMAFWSSPLRCEKVIRDVKAYKGYQLLEISLENFINHWIPNLKKDALIIGTNLSGKGLIGHDWNLEELLEEIKYQLDKQLME